MDVYALVGVCFSASYGIAYLILGLWEAVAVSALSGAACGVIAMLNRRGWRFLRSPLVLICTMQVLAVSVWCVGVETGIHYHLLVIALASIALMTEGATLASPILVALSLGSFLAAQYLLDVEPLRSPGPIATQALHLSVPLSMVIMIGFIIWDYQRRLLNLSSLLSAELRRSDELLTQLLPSTIASRLKSSPSVRIADRHEDIVVLFADICDFTRTTWDLPPDKVVSLLESTFASFDQAKVKAMGDGYLVAGGIPAPLPDALARAAELAMDLMASSKVKLRIGIHVGPVVAGVIDQKLPFYDVWGSTVNLASRMESTAEPGRIQVTQAVKDRLPDYRFSERGDVDVKGHGKMNTWYLEGRPPTV